MMSSVYFACSKLSKSKKPEIHVHVQSDLQFHNFDTNIMCETVNAMIDNHIPSTGSGDFLFESDTSE